MHTIKATVITAPPPPHPLETLQPCQRHTAPRSKNSPFTSCPSSSSVSPGAILGRSRHHQHCSRAGKQLKKLSLVSIWLLCRAPQPLFVPERETWVLVPGCCSPCPLPRSPLRSSRPVFIFPSAYLLLPRQPSSVSLLRCQSEAHSVITPICSSSQDVESKPNAASPQPPLP